MKGEVTKGYPENLSNHRIAEGSFQTSLVYPTPVDCEEGSNQTSLRNTTEFCLREQENKSSLTSLKKIKFPRIGIPIQSAIKENNTSPVTFEELIRRVKLYNPNMKKILRKNKPSSKILAFSHAQSQEMLERSMRKRKSKRKEEKKPTPFNDIILQITFHMNVLYYLENSRKIDLQKL